MATLALIGAGKQELDKVKSYQLGAHVVGAELPHRLHEDLLRRRHQVLKQRRHAPGMRHERQSAPRWKMSASTSAMPYFVVHVALGVLQAAVHLGFRRTAPGPPAPTTLTQPGLGRGQRGEILLPCCALAAPSTTASSSPPPVRSGSGHRHLPLGVPPRDGRAHRRERHRVAS